MIIFVEERGGREKRRESFNGVCVHFNFYLRCRDKLLKLVHRFDSSVDPVFSLQVQTNGYNYIERKKPIQCLNILVVVLSSSITAKMIWTTNQLCGLVSIILIRSGRGYI